MTINKAVAQSDNIKLNVLSSQDEIFHGEAIKWSVKFPYQDVLPKLTQIKFNRIVICSNHPDPLVSGITQTSMWAKATIRTSAGASESNPAVPGGQMPPQYPEMGYAGMQQAPVYQQPYGGYGPQPGGPILQN
nr:uncharacterized protein LOC111418704 [Onthophagus taurus]XP_022907115.1 uncharacterized protein LOC111418704 [Onthophagus taurus]